MQFLASAITERKEATAFNQTTIPQDFNNLWRVAGYFDELEHAQKMCRVLGSERASECGLSQPRIELSSSLGNLRLIQRWFLRAKHLI
jgi:hypothetical protein